MNRHDGIHAQPFMRAFVTLLSFVVMIPLPLDEVSGVLVTLSVFFMSKFTDIWTGFYFDNIPNKPYIFILIVDITLSVITFVLIWKVDSISNDWLGIIIVGLLVFAFIYVFCDFYILVKKVQQVREHEKAYNKVKNTTEE